MLIGKNYKIESDSLNVTLCKRGISKRGKHAGEETWTPIGYFSAPKDALKHLITLGVKGTGLTDLSIVVKEMEKLHHLIDGLNIERMYEEERWIKKR